VVVKKKKNPTKVINLLTQPRFEPGIFLVKIQTSPVHHPARLYRSVSEDVIFILFKITVSISGEELEISCNGHVPTTLGALAWKC